MKQLATPIFIMMLTLGQSAQAATVGGIELTALVDTLSASSGDFLDFTSVDASDIITNADLTSHLTDASESTYVLSVNANAYVDLSFNTVNIYNGDGHDLAIFFAGSLDSTGAVIIDFEFDVDADGPLSSIRYTPEITPEVTVVRDAFGEYTLTAALIDLDDFGWEPDRALEDFRVYLGSNNSTNRPSLSMVGGFHTSPGSTVVPLPLPVLLLGSGLALIGLIARKK